MKIRKLTIATNSIGGNMGRTIRISSVGGRETQKRTLLDDGCARAEAPISLDTED
jgi:hypothetical protein